MQERASTGRIYIANVDHINEHGAFIPALAPVRQSNLCMEITLPTRPLAFTDDPNGEIALCTLSAFNLRPSVHWSLLKRWRSMPLLHWIRYWIIKTIRWRQPKCLPKLVVAWELV